jgi:hypothetical protein
MASPQYQHFYQQFNQQLTTLRQSRIDTTAPAIATDLKQATTELQKFFQEQISCLNLDELAPDLAHFILSYQVEIDKQLRLLAMDVSFLQAARQPATLSQRQQQIDDRLTTLQRYCEAVLSR